MSSSAKKTPFLRIAWLGITLSAILWFAPPTYFEKIERFHEIELQTGSISEKDYNDITSGNAHCLVACRLCASILMLGSLIYLLSNVEIRRQSKDTNIP